MNCNNMFLHCGDWVWRVKEARVLPYNGKCLIADNSIHNYRPSWNSLGSGLLVTKKVIFNPPATIVIWEDGTKTIVKCMEGDTYDAEKGLALCYMKKACEYYGFSYQKELKQAKDWTKSVIPASLLEEDFVAKMFKAVEKWERERYESRQN